MIVRPPKFSEIEVMVSMAKQMHSEGEFATIPFDDAYFYYFVRSALEKFHDNEGTFIAVAEDTERHVVGGMIGAMSPYAFSPERYAVDLGIYVLPERRGASAAYRLINEFERWAKSNNAHEVKCGVSTGVNIEKAHEFYTKLGYNYLGGLYAKKFEGSV